MNLERVSKSYKDINVYQNQPLWYWCWFLRARSIAPVWGELSFTVGHSCKAQRGSSSSMNCIAFTRVSFTTHSLARSLRSLARSIALAWGELSFTVGHSCEAQRGSRSFMNCNAFTKVSFTTHSLARSLRSLTRSIALQMLLVSESVCPLIFTYFHEFRCSYFDRFSLMFNDFHKRSFIFKGLYGCSSIFINVHWFVLIVK